VVKRVSKKAQQRANFKRRLKAKLGNVCVLCGYNDASDLTFHHVFANPKERDSVGHVMRTRGHTIAEKEALARCVLLCPECHVKAHTDWRAAKQIEEVFIDGNFREETYSGCSCPDAGA
jgi:5-methylcytosine-specific restriction endonuclease McrA